MIGVAGTQRDTRGRNRLNERSFQLDVHGGVIEIAFEPGQFDLSADHILHWVSEAARAVATYYGAFPVPSMHLRVESSDERTGVFHGTTWGSRPPFTRIVLGRHTRQDELDADWMLTHEFVHTAFPNVADGHHWIEEGIATYVEPIARVQAGELSADIIWADMVRDMSKGQPHEGDAGLDHTHTWGRTYWGGALFCLSADVQIRLATQNRLGLQSGLCGIQRQGGTIDVDWPIERAFVTADRATNTTVLSTLYEKTKDEPVTFDLQSMWRNLGVTIGAQGGVSFDDDADWADIRIAITAPHTF